MARGVKGTNWIVLENVQEVLEEVLTEHIVLGMICFQHRAKEPGNFFRLRREVDRYS